MCKNVSVIMATYKEDEKFLREAIESILGQSYDNFEFIIIIDNPENNLHIEIIKDYMKNDSRIKMYINEVNIGLTKTLNKGLSLAQGKYICRMDADDISYSNRIEKEINYLENNKLDLIGGGTKIINENGETIFSIQKMPSDSDKIRKVLKYNQCLVHPTWFGKKEVFEQLEGYRDIPLCEDYDFTLRAVLKGFRISILNEVVLKYRMTSQSISRNNLYEQFLYAKFITKEYSKGNIADVNLAKKYVEKHFTKEKAQRYVRANTLFNTALENLENRQFFTFVGNGFRLLFCSYNYLIKIYRLVRVYIS